MNQQRIFWRRIYYLIAVGGLMVPLSIMGQPSTSLSSAGRDASGGMLAQLRQKQNLSQANLGQIDPTSASMKLATFGMHGLASNLLWSKAIKAKERGDWVGFNAALEQITHLQPHFVQVWKFQAHNVSFNISVEFDDYRDRYHYVIKGFNLLRKGIRYNERQPRILNDLAHFTGFKIGKADEKRLYRALYRADDEYHDPPPELDWLRGTRYANRPASLRDNWLVAKWWYRQSEELVFREELTYRGLTPQHSSTKKLLEMQEKYGVNPVVFHANAPKMQMQYAIALQEEAEFRDQDDADLDTAQRAWSEAAEDWEEYSHLPLQTSRGYAVRLSDQDDYRERSLKRFKELVALDPEVLNRLLKRRRDELTDRILAAVDTPFAERTENQHSLLAAVAHRRSIDPREIAQEMQEANQDEALKIAERYEIAAERARLIDAYRDVVSFDTWEIRCEVERQPETLQARRAIHAGNRAYQDGDVQQALAQYRQGIADWKKVLDAHPQLLDEMSMVEDLTEVSRQYRTILQQNDLPWPETYELQQAIDRYEEFLAQEF